MMVRETCGEAYTREPTWNVKCILLTAFLALGYWYAPQRNKWILLALLFFPYLALAWYDFLYSCEENLGPTYLSLFYAWFKPRRSQQIQDFQRWDPEIKRRVLVVDGVLLVVVLSLVPWFLTWNPTKF